MSTVRSCLPLLCLTGGVLAAGCGDHGSYKVEWDFPGEAAESGCGQHGVDSLRITGMNAGGEGHEAVMLCAAGSFATSVPVGNWTFTVRQLDVRGQPIVVTDDQGQQLPDPTVTGNITKDTETTLDPIVLIPRPVCSDGVDNETDGPPDGRVDLDDSACGGAANTSRE